MIDNGDGATTTKIRIDWIRIIIELLVVASLLIGYIISNERWKGGVEEQLKQFELSRERQLQNQKDTNQVVAAAIIKLTDNMTVIAGTQQKVVGLLDQHMRSDEANFKKVIR